MTYITDRDDRQCVLYGNWSIQIWIVNFCYLDVGVMCPDKLHDTNDFNCQKGFDSCQIIMEYNIF